ncbi:MAG: SDR family NAD(P)-dependent oxidoreductase [Acetatifactor muris]|nr:SDR family NAD(P)-dependent oxidoreductase [Acetatifactor muris]MCM1526645.1 SDR family NAD(P)-dependent oxidoreductase [Bacteroides sp.]
MRLNVEQQTWLITGISSGIGHELTGQLLEKGHRVIGFVRDEHKVRVLKESYPETLILYETDIRNYEETDRIVRTACETAGTIHAVVSNAGIATKGLAEEVSMEELLNVMNTNLIGTMVFIRACIPFLKKTGAKLIQISSMSGEVSAAEWSYYCASKHGINGFCESVAEELRPYGVSVTLVEPGNVNTQLWNKVADRQEKYDALRANSEQSDINVRKLAAGIMMLGRMDDPPEYVAMGSRANENILQQLARKQKIYLAGRQLAREVDEQCGGAQPLLKSPQQAGERKILLWPLGNECKKMLRAYDWSEWADRLAGFVDLDESKAGKYCVGRKIYQYEEAALHCQDYYFVVMTNDFRKPIEQMLKEMNLVYGKDFCHYSDLVEEAT